MPALTGPALTAALLLAFAGAAKVVDPTMTVGALRALRLPSSPTLVRAGGGAELVLGLSAVTAGWAAVWWLVAASYLGFAAFVVAALRAGTMVGSCGCFGREETPPHPGHVVLDAALAAAAGAAAVLDLGAPLDATLDEPGQGAVVVGLSVLAVLLLYAAFVDLPRAITQRRHRFAAPAGHHGGHERASASES
jgi:Methylamine utilisation protein MauE